MNRSEGIAMADEQNQGNTIINQGTTIDNLPGLDGMTPAQKQAFIDSAFVPIRGTISGEMSTRKVTGGDLNPVPAPGTNENRGKVLTVNDSDKIVWEVPQGGGLPPAPGLPPVISGGEYKTLQIKLLGEGDNHYWSDPMWD